MKPSDTILESAGEAYGYAKAYVEQQVEYAKLDLVERISIAISTAVSTVVVSLLFLMVLGFLSLAGGFFLAQKLGSAGEAFLIIGGIYAVLAIFALLFRRVLITNPILSRIIKIFFE